MAFSLALISYSLFSIDDESGYVVGNVTAVNEKGDKFAVTIEDAEGYYEDEIGNQAGFGVENFTIVETEIVMGKKLKVTYTEIDGKVSAIRIEKYGN
ncbi:hypothetical protein Metev_2224 [Methanohalobium evestigatum Z-7303]|uniref:Uncharacterized protein n=1 Tax=Methanohalobium evestigatum (strain ATCC BAA-1072 / DSM 3721 / NBRC 107634 / OCM 161 / Z-7303) TaxID=644295 RepID=D7EAQ0_METEZ|nr:hypothetical protein [Methanohalobium evestigatum]ADI75049.1 hypothetical protein Metev_2224 [Methanohalobium evestigatum Z-7303]